MGFVVSKFLYMPPNPSYDLESFPHSLIFIPLNPDIPIKDTSASAIPALYIHRKDAKRIIIYCHGNAADLGLIYPEACHISHHLNCHVVCVEYPGYGAFFPGVPSESNTVATLLTVVEYLHHEMKCELGSMILYGRSLGTAVVSQVAAILTKKYPNTYSESGDSGVVTTTVSNHAVDQGQGHPASSFLSAIPTTAEVTIEVNNNARNEQERSVSMLSSNISVYANHRDSNGSAAVLHQGKQPQPQPPPPPRARHHHQASFSSSSLDTFTAIKLAHDEGSLRTSLPQKTTVIGEDEARGSVQPLEVEEMVVDDICIQTRPYSLTVVDLGPTSQSSLPGALLNDLEHHPPPTPQHNSMSGVAQYGQGPGHQETTPQTPNRGYRAPPPFNSTVATSDQQSRHLRPYWHLLPSKSKSGQYHQQQHHRYKSQQQQRSCPPATPSHALESPRNRVTPPSPPLIATEAAATASASQPNTMPPAMAEHHPPPLPALNLTDDPLTGMTVAHTWASASNRHSIDDDITLPPTTADGSPQNAQTAQSLVKSQRSSPPASPAGATRHGAVRPPPLPVSPVSRTKPAIPPSPSMLTSHTMRPHPSNSDASGDWTHLSHTQSFSRSSSFLPRTLTNLGANAVSQVSRIQMLRSKTPLCGLILHSPFTSINDIIKSAAYSSLFLQDQYITKLHIQDISCPTLFIHGMKDKLIPYNHSQALMEASDGVKKRLHLCPNADHNNFDFYFDVLTPISQFIRQYCHNRHTILDVHETQCPPPPATPRAAESVPQASLVDTKPDPLVRYGLSSPCAAGPHESQDASSDRTNPPPRSPSYVTPVSSQGLADIEAALLSSDDIQTRHRALTTIVHPVNISKCSPADDLVLSDEDLTGSSSPQVSHSYHSPEHSGSGSGSPTACEPFMTFDPIADAVVDLPPALSSSSSTYSDYRAKALQAPYTQRRRQAIPPPFPPALRASIGAKPASTIPSTPGKSGNHRDEQGNAAAHMPPPSTPNVTTTRTTTTVTIDDDIDSGDKYLQISLPEHLFRPPRDVRRHHIELRQNTKFQSHVVRFPIHALAQKGKRPENARLPAHLLLTSDEEYKLISDTITADNDDDDDNDRNTSHKKSHIAPHSPIRHHSPARTRANKRVQVVPGMEPATERKFSIEIVTATDKLPSHDVATSPQGPYPRTITPTTAIDINHGETKGRPSSPMHTPQHSPSESFNYDRASALANASAGDSGDEDSNNYDPGVESSVQETDSTTNGTEDYNGDDDDDDIVYVEHYDAAAIGAPDVVEMGSSMMSKISISSLQHMRKSLSQSAADQFVTLYPAKSQ